MVQPNSNPSSSVSFDDDSEFYSFRPSALTFNPWIGFDGVTKPLPNVAFKLSTGSWLSLCVQMKEKDRNVVFVANGKMLYNAEHPGLKQFKFNQNKTATSLVLMKRINARVADVFFASRKISVKEMIGFTACNNKLENPQI